MSNDSQQPEDFKPVKLTRKKGKARMITLFTLDDKEYQIKDKLNPNLGLLILREIDKKGEQLGGLFMLEKLLGEENFKSLMEFEDLEADDLNTIIKLATHVVFGETEDPKE